ncbi:MAG: class I SAM-dependent methyltransferase [Thermoanaerobaculia bacterium]|nr:class I SAM-dependent methyltransferase [Thermoanaerobaculia bacterium]
MRESPTEPRDHHRRAGAAYDAFAEAYDHALARDLWARRVLWRHHRRLFGAGDRVLDVACGTGADSLALAHRGVRVVAADLSPGMLVRLRRKSRAEDLSARVTPVALNVERPGLAPRTPFDGIVSSFAGINTLRDPRAFAATAASLLRPGGRMVLHLLASPERGGDTATRTIELGGQSVDHLLYSPRQAYRLFAPWFRLRLVYSLDGVLAPRGWAARLPVPLGTALGLLEAAASRRPPLLGRGRFSVLDLEPRPTSQESCRGGDSDPSSGRQAS